MSVHEEKKLAKQRWRTTWLWPPCRVMKALQKYLRISNNADERLGNFPNYCGEREAVSKTITDIYCCKFINSV